MLTSGVSILFLYTCIVSSVSVAEIDWSPFEIVGILNPAESKEIIRQLPIQQYWDVQKGSFRTGIIGEALNQTFPEFVSTVEMKVNKGGKLVTVDNSVVDASALFMHGLAALSYLAQFDDLMQSSAQFSRPFDTGGAEFHGSLAKDFVSVEELGVLREALEVQRSRIDTDQWTEEQLHRLKRDALQTRNDSTRQELRRQHTVKLDAAAEHSRQLSDTAAAKFRALLGTVQESEESLRRQKLLHAEGQHAEAVAALRRQVGLAMEALAFRAAEELKVVLQQQQFEETQLLATKSELLQSEVEGVINTFFSELRSCAQMLLDNPTVTLTALQYAVAAVVVLLTLLELVQLLLAVARKISGASYLPQVVSLTAANANLGPDAALPNRRWPGQVGSQLNHVLTSLDAAVSNGLPLPVVLVSGPSGSGKSTVAELVVQRAQQASAGAAQRFSLLRVCGADLQALGNAEATQFLNDLVRSYSASGVGGRSGALLLVVDDADSILAARGGAVQDGESPADSEAAPGRSAPGCLFALLTGLRGNSSRIAVVLATRLPLDGGHLDEAMLDRVDLSVVLPLPDESQRLHFAAEALQKLRDRTGHGAAQEGEWDLLSGAAATGASREDVSAHTMMSAVLGTVLPARIRSALAAAAVAAAGAGTASVVASVRAPSACPETDTPTEGDPTGAADSSCAAAADGAEAGRLLAVLRSSLLDFADDGLDLRLCLRVMLAVSGRWSYRDLKQFFSALNYATMCSDSAQLTTRMWVRELVYAFD